MQFKQVPVGCRCGAKGVQRPSGTSKRVSGLLHVAVVLQQSAAEALCSGADTPDVLPADLADPECGLAPAGAWR